MDRIEPKLSIKTALNRSFSVDKSVDHTNNQINMEQETIQCIPHVVSEEKLKITDDFSVRLYVLDDGRRIIQEDDMRDVLVFLGISQAEFDKVVTNRIKFKQNGNNCNQR